MTDKNNADPNVSNIQVYNERIRQIKANRAKIGPWWFALIVSGVIVSLFISWAFTARFNLDSSDSSEIFFGVLIALAIIIIVKGWEIVPENYIWVIQLNGKYMASWKAGLHISFPFFVARRARVNMTEIRRRLFQGKSSDFKVNFNDAATFVYATYHYGVIDEDAVLAVVYGVGDLIKGLDDRLETALRSACGLYTLDEANMSKGFFDLCSVIIHHEEVEKVLASGKTLKNLSNEERLALISKIYELIAQNRENFKEKRYYSELKEWGINIFKLSLINIDMPEHIQKAREAVLMANEQLEASLVDNEKLVKKANAEAEAKIAGYKADAEGIELKGKALAAQIQSLVAIGKLSAQEAQEMLTNFEKWKSLGDKTVVVDGTSNAVMKTLIEAGIAAKTGFNLNDKNIGG